MYSKIPNAPNFTYNEYLKSDTAIRLGIENIPNETQLKAIELNAQYIMQPVRDEFGAILITSGFRSPELCLAVNSYKIIDGKKVVTSNHAKGEATDFEPYDQDMPLIEIIEWIHDNLEYRELIAEFFPNGWIHCAYRKGDNSRILKLKDKDHNYTRVTIDYIKSLYVN